MSPDAMTFIEYQTAFADRIRNPRNTRLPPGAPARRMRAYEELLFNNLDGFLGTAYPVTRKMLGKRAWKNTVRRFFVEHRSHSPLFRDIPKAFLDWMNDEAESIFPGLPFLAEFMHYEWLELVVSIAPDEISPAEIDPDGDLLAGRPALDPSARLACYRYPVHRIGPRFKPLTPSEDFNCYLLFRDVTDEVHFITLNPLSARLLAMIRDHRPSGREALAHLAGQTNPDQYETYLAAGWTLLADLRAQGALLGTWREK